MITQIDKWCIINYTSGKGMGRWSIEHIIGLEIYPHAIIPIYEKNKRCRMNMHIKFIGTKKECDQNLFGIIKYAHYGTYKKIAKGHDGPLGQAFSRSIGNGNFSIS